MQTFDPKVFGHVALLMGGNSAERDISLVSGQAVLAALRRLGVAVSALDPRDADWLTRLLAGGFARALIMLHGRGGEDGRIQGLLDSIGLPYTGSGVLGSAIGMDKVRTKRLWLGAGLPTPAFAVLRNDADLPAARALGLPLMVKPAREGSSLGMTKVTEDAALGSAVQAALAYGGEAIAESWLPGPEYTCAILDGRALPLIKLETPRAFYDFEAKYRAESTRYLCPCGLPAAREAEVQNLCLRAFAEVGASGWGRVDLLFDADGTPSLLEINTVPGMTDHSLVPMAAAAAGLDFDALVAAILATSLEQGGRDG